MECRSGCGACCSAISINGPFHGMPAGKPAGVVCVHLTVDLACRLFNDPRRPICCVLFAPEPAFCGTSREQALANLGRLEALTLPG